MAYVVKITASSGATRDVHISDGEFTIGRDPSNTLVLSGRGVSRRHAKIVKKDASLVIVDLGSTYGTRVNDMAALRRKVGLGDRITIGMHTLEIVERTTTTTLETPAVFDEPYFPDEPTHDPQRDLSRDRSGSLDTMQLDAGAVQFVSDEQIPADQFIEVITDNEGAIYEAVKRNLESSEYRLDTGRVSSTSTADYQALLLMYKVSELLAGAADLDSFINSVADLVMEQVRADTVVVLSRSADGDVQPRVIRHRGALDPGEVPISRSIIEMVIRSRAPVISADALNDERIKAGQSLALYNIKAVLAAPLLLENDVRGVLYLNRSGPVPFTKADGELVAALAALLASSMERAELKERIIAEKQRRTQLERFHPPEVVDKLFAATDGLYGVEEHRVTALVCDMLGFEELTGSGAPPDFLAQVLTQYYELVYEKIFGNGGTLVKLHDGWALALFGMHGSVDRDAMWAIQAGRELCEEFSGLAQIWPEQANLSLRCALDTGIVVAGVVGTGERLEYVALGVPITATCELAKIASETSLMLTQETWSTLPHKRYQAREVPALSGRTVYRLEF